MKKSLGILSFVLITLLVASSQGLCTRNKFGINVCVGDTVQLMNNSGAYLHPLGSSTDVVTAPDHIFVEKLVQYDNTSFPLWLVYSVDGQEYVLSASLIEQ